MNTDYAPKSKVKDLNDAIEDVMYNKDKTKTLEHFCIKAQGLIDYFIEAANLDKIDDLIHKDYNISKSDKQIINDAYTKIDFLADELTTKMNKIDAIETELETKGFGESCPLSMKETIEEYNGFKDVKEVLDFSIQIIDLYTEEISILNNLMDLRDSIEDGSYRKSLQERAQDELANEIMLYGELRQEPKQGKNFEIPMVG